MTRLETLSQWIYDKKKSLFLAAFLSFQLASAGLLFLDFDAFEAKVEPFNPGQTLVLYLEFLDADQFSSAHLDLLGELDDLAHTLPLVRSVRSASTFQIPFVDRVADATTMTKADIADGATGVDGGGTVVDDAERREAFAIKRLAESEIRFKPLATWASEGGDFDAVLAYIKAQQQLKGIMIADDYSGAIVIAQLDRSYSSGSSAGSSYSYSYSYSGLMEIITGFSSDKLMDAAELMVQKFENSNPGVKVYIVGSAGLKRALLDEFIYFLILTLPLIVVVVGLSVVWVSGDVGLTAAGLIASASTVGATVGVFGWLPVTLDPSAFLAVLLIMVLAVTHCIHIGGSYILAFNQSNSKQEALTESIRVNVKPLFYNSAIASAGLIALLGTGVESWMVFSAMALVGIAIGYVYSFIFMIVIADRLPELRKDKKLPTDAWVTLAHRWVLSKPKQIIIGFFALFALVGGGLTQVSVEGDLEGYFTHGNKFDAGTHVMESDFLWNKQFQLVIADSNSEVIITSQLIQDLNRFRAWLTPQFEYVKVLGIDNILADLNATLNEPIETLALLNRIDSSTLGGWDVRRGVNDLQNKILITIYVEDIGDSELLALKNNSANWWVNKNNGYEIDGFGGDVFGDDGFGADEVGGDVILAEISEFNVDGSILGAAIATVLIALLLMVALRSVTWGLLSVLMIALPFSVVLTVYGTVYSAIIPAMCVAFPIALGVIAINPLHFLSAFRAHQNTHRVDDALQRSFELSGLGMSAVTVAISVFGAVLYVTSGLMLHAIIGGILASTVLLSGLCSLLLLPAIVVVFSSEDSSLSDSDETSLRDAA